MEQKIDEMAKEITDVWNNECQFVACNGCKYNDLNDNQCQEKLIADRLYQKGYRKQSEGEWVETAFRFPKCSCCDKDLGEFIDGEDIRIDLPPYCPNCGAHMTGGAE